MQHYRLLRLRLCVLRTPLRISSRGESLLVRIADARTSVQPISIVIQPHSYDVFFLLCTKTLHWITSCSDHLPHALPAIYHTVCLVPNPWRLSLLRSAIPVPFAAAASFPETSSNQAPRLYGTRSDKTQHTRLQEFGRRRSHTEATVRIHGLGAASEHRGFQMNRLPEDQTAAHTTLPTKNEGEPVASVPVQADILMSGDGDNGTQTDRSALTAHENARELVRLIQCTRCSRPFRTPVTLPCGNSLCRECLPAAHERERVSYPDLPNRRHAFRCPFPDCAEEHPVSDCNVDVVLSKVMDSIAEVIVRQASVATGKPTRIEAPANIVGDNPALDSEKTICYEIPGGRLVATYTLATQANLAFDSNIIYHSDADAALENAADVHVLSELLESTNREVDCQVCYNLMLDPVTTHCGHTLCRRCLARVLDHSLHCPVCRRGLSISPSLVRQWSNKALVNLLNGLCPDIVAARAVAMREEEQSGEGELNTPLFVCTLSFPHQPTFLRIFEPRYRLMLRRCLEGNREFGMLMYNRYFEPQGDLGPVQFYHYGTMLHIIHSQVLPDGTSLIETRGAYRFRVKAHGTLDGYTVGSVERVDDAELVEEERIEAEETAQPPAEEGDVLGAIARMSTQDLLALCQDFVTRMQARSATWLQQRVLDINGQPPGDAALFPYWFATVLPISDEEKYKLLATSTVRERLKITASWIRRIESQRW